MALSLSLVRFRLVGFLALVFVIICRCPSFSLQVPREFWWLTLLLFYSLHHLAFLALQLLVHTIDMTILSLFTIVIIFLHSSVRMTRAAVYMIVFSDAIYMRYVYVVGDLPTVPYLRMDEYLLLLC